MSVQFMGGEWDGQPRTVGFFLESEPVDICEVVAQILVDPADQESGVGTLGLSGRCKQAWTANGVCKHTYYVWSCFRLHGKIPVAIEASVPPDVIAEARQDTQSFRELLIQRGQVRVL